MTVSESIIAAEEKAQQEQSWNDAKAKGAVKETLISSKEQQRPWVETPLKESYGLSRAAGW